MSEFVAPQPSHNPVVLVHGFGDTHRVFRVMSQYLRDRGWQVYAPDLSPCRGEVSLVELARQLKAYIDNQLPSSVAIDIVGFSMGGLVSRYYLQRLGGAARVQRWISISSPHAGTWMAYVFNRPGCLEMRPASKFLLELDRDVREVLGQLDFTSIWTPYDLMILPARSSQLPLGQEFQIPVWLHPWMLSDRRCIEQIESLLSRPYSRASSAARPPSANDSPRLRSQSQKME